MLETLMVELNLPKFDLKISFKNRTYYIYDIIRKKDIKLTKEEWVRQNIILYLIKNKSVPLHFIAVEKALSINKRVKRFDIVVYSRIGTPAMLIECKSPDIQIDDETLFQIANYNKVLNTKHLLLTNGITHISTFIDTTNFKLSYLDYIPNFEELNAIE